MLGLTRARQAIEEKVTRPVNSALILSIFAVILAAIALLIGVSK